MVQFKCLSFYELSLDELYAIMALRQEIFVVEQNCPFIDADGKDQKSWHVLGQQISSSQASDPENTAMRTPSSEEEGLVAYTRLLPKGLAYPDYASIGRVVNSASVRGQGVGKLLMAESIRHIRHLCPNDPVKIGAQSYLLSFYESFGFVSTGEEYLEDGIPHTCMVLAD
jgi:ElaA protein